MLNQSETLGALAKALAKAQGEIKPAEFDKKNPAFKSGGKESKYASLAAIWAAARPALAANGLSVIQGLGTADGNAVEVSTRILHESGEWLESTLTLPAKQADPQGHGSAITYARRYALSSMLGVCADDDDDANSATEAHRQHQPANPGPQPFRPVSQPAPPPESNGDKAAAGQPKLGLELDAKREEIKALLAEIDQRGVDISAKKREFAQHWSTNPTCDLPRAETIIEGLQKVLNEAPTDDNPTPAAFR